MLIARFGGGELAKIAELEERYHITFPEEYFNYPKNQV